MKAMIFDVDGTLADVRSIAHMLTHYPKAGESYPEFDEYHDLAVHVPTVPWVAETLRQAHKDEYIVFVVTARRGTYVEQTGAFLIKNDLWTDMLMMREDDDDRSNVELKTDFLRRIERLGYKVEKAYDDEPAIIEMYQQQGIDAVLVQGAGFNHE